MVEQFRKESNILSWGLDMSLPESSIKLSIKANKIVQIKTILPNCNSFQTNDFLL